MKLRFMSDLHLEFYPSPAEMWMPSLDDSDVFILAGDIFADNSYSPAWLARLLKQYDVIYVPGNHEPYGSYFTMPNYYAACKQAQELAGDEHKIHYGSRFVVIKDDVRFICTTMWTDFNKENWITMKHAQRGMNDYERIIVNENRKKLKPDMVLVEHRLNYGFVAAELAKPWHGKTVVVTHHAPCSLSSLEHYKGDELTYCYFRDMPELVEQANLWIHGHMHNTSDYVIGDKPGFGRIVTNPRGYDWHSGLNPDFNELKTITL